MVNESLRSAQAAWDTEPTELDAMRQELADAVSRADKAEARMAEIEHRAADLRNELDRAHSDAERVRLENIEARKQAATEIDAARTELVRMQAKAEALEQTHAEQRKQDAVEAKRAAEQLTKTQGERDDATRAAALAKEHAAGLAGQLQATQAQNAALLATFKPVP